MAKSRKIYNEFTNFSGFCPWFLIFITIPALKDGPIENGILNLNSL